MFEDGDHNALESSCNNKLHPVAIRLDKESNTADNAEKHGAVWTTNSTSILLRLYESKLEMLETPKKKTGIWQAVSENLKDFNIDMSPNQVRWKINALTKKYKQCLDSGHDEKFRYFHEMDNIYAQYNVDCDSYIITELLQRKKTINIPDKPENIYSIKSTESKAMIELRKIRLANRIESDRNQGKIHLERQWLEFLKRKEEEKQCCDVLFEKNLKLREEKLELRKRKLELKESFEHKKINLMEKEYEDMLEIERKKHALLKQLFQLDHIR